MSNEEEQMLDEALIKTYADFGITHDNDSVYVDKDANPPVLKEMPILGDLHKNLLDNPMTQRIADYRKPICNRFGAVVQQTNKC